MLIHLLPQSDQFAAGFCLGHGHAATSKTREFHLGGSLRKGCDSVFIIPELAFEHQPFSQLKRQILPT
jgi:hypothetical protein